MFSGSEQEIQEMLNSLGEFGSIKNVSKKAARIGLLFSSCQPTIRISECKLIDDIKHNGYTFTDGKHM